MSSADLIRLFHHRWAAPALVELERERGTRFVLLANRLGASRAVLRPALDALLELGLVRRNPGYGHPLRPEYLTTPAGGRVAARLARILGLVARHDLLLRKWTLPTVAVLGQAKRFSELRETLPGVTPRALTLALKDLQALGLAEREVVDAYPPAVVYRPTALGRRIRRLLDG
jgi:DNA-binding HxlR family transcriptional regulator